MIARVSSLALVASAIAATSSLVAAQPLESRAGFSCEAPGKAGWLYKGDVNYGSAEPTLLGTFGNPDGPNAASPTLIAVDARISAVSPFQVQITRCTFDGLSDSKTKSGQSFEYYHPVKLQVVGRKNKCVSLGDLTKPNARLVEADCSSKNDAASQEPQFFLQHYKYGNLKPYGTAKKSYTLYVEDSPTGAIIANPEGCFDGQTCQTDNSVSLFV